MDFDEVFCPGGEISQSGKAVQKRYCGASIKDAGKIDSIPELLKDINDKPFVTPIWNSNQGEIEKSEYVWNMVRNSDIKILDIWPKRIEFLCLVRDGFTLPFRKIGSVIVATTQCSKFLDEHKCSIDVGSFSDYALSSDALKAFNNNEDGLDGVLVPPGNDYTDFSVFEENSENENNFTSFMTISEPSFDISKDNQVSFLTGVSMQTLKGEIIDKVQQSFFQKIFEECNHVNEFPSLIFVFNRANEMGLLFEDGVGFSEGDFLDAEQIEEGSVVVHEDIGALDKAYSLELKELISAEFDSLDNKDFFKHQGDRASLFSCPPLGIYTHGFNDEIVMEVVVYYLNLLFQYIFNYPDNCENEHIEFFKKYECQWQSEGLKFFERMFEENSL